MHKAYYDGKISFDKSKLLLKKSEVESLRKLCAELSKKLPDSHYILDGYYVGYSIPQIANEFDLLRFGKDCIVNIELKSRLPEERLIETIYIQMRKQNYYLKFLEKELRVYTYVEDEGFFIYSSESDKVEAVDIQMLINDLTNQQVDFDIDPDTLFKPSNYLVSPFNKVERFMSGEYFLTPDQAKKKKEILEAIDENRNLFFCISADAGTGKTLLTYDIAKTYQQQGKSVLVLHCAVLNEGQIELIRNYHWNIKSVSALRAPNIACVVCDSDIIIVDEAHRMWQSQLDDLLEYAYENKIHVVFSYDPKQYLKKGEDKDIYSYLMNEYSAETDELRSLTKKIRTNKKIASFIRNMKAIGSSKDNLDYENITIEYFNCAEDAQRYMDYLDLSGEWKAITFTASKLMREPIDSLSVLCERKAHSVIGQEFDKVVFAMDSNFRYSERNRLQYRGSYYNLYGMWYQIVTRAVNELKIIVIDNPELYEKLMEIKLMGQEE